MKVVATRLLVKDKLVRRVDLYMDKGDVMRISKMSPSLGGLGLVGAWAKLSQAGPYLQAYPSSGSAPKPTQARASHHHPLQFSDDYIEYTSCIFHSQMAQLNIHGQVRVLG